MGVSVCLSGWWLFRLPLASAPPAALPPCRPADDDRGAGGLRQVLAPPRHPGGDAEALGGRLLEQVLCAPSGLRQWKDSGQVGSPPCSRSQCRVRHACVECVPQALSETSYFLLLLPSLALAFTLCQGLPWWLRWQRICLQSRHLGSIPGSGISPGEGNGNPLQYSCLGNTMDRRAWRAAVPGV